MPKIRTIKPSFFLSRSIKRLNDEQKLVFIGLLPNADDEGRMIDEPEIIAGQLWALSKSANRIEKILTVLAAENRILRYEVAGQSFIQIINWHEHQKITRVAVSTIPPVPANVAAAQQQSDNSAAAVPLHGGKGKEGKGKEGEASDDAEPPLFCSLHWVTRSKGPCPQCADARRIHDAWSRRQAAKPAPSTPRITRPAVCEHEYPLGECPYCPAEAVAS